jgi:hypothetical protein
MFNLKLIMHANPMWFTLLATAGIAIHAQAQPFEVRTLFLGSGGELSRGGAFVACGRAGGVPIVPMESEIFALHADWAPPFIDAPAITPVDPVRIARVTRMATGLSLSFTSTPHHQYVLQTRDVIASGSWSNVPGATAMGTGEILEIIFNDALSDTQRFYRIQILP